MPVTVTMSSFAKAFAGVMKLRLLRWGDQPTKCHHMSPYKGEGEARVVCTQGKAKWSHRKRLEDIGLKHGNDVTMSQRMPVATRSWNGHGSDSPRDPWREHSPAATLFLAQQYWFGTSVLQNWERINFCWFKWLSLYNLLQPQESSATSSFKGPSETPTQPFMNTLSFMLSHIPIVNSAFVFFPLFLMMFGSLVFNPKGAKTVIIN